MNKQKKDGASMSIWQFKAMEYVLYGGLVMIPLFVASQHWFPFGTPKALLIYLMIFLMLGLFGWGLLVQKKQENLIRITPLHGMLALFLGVLIIGALIGIDPHNSFFGVWSQSINLVLLASLGIFSTLVSFLVKHDQQIIPRLVSWSFFSSVIFSVIAYTGTNFFALSRNGSTLGNSSFAGAYLVFTICFGVGLLFWYKKYWQKVMIAIGLLITLFSPIFFNHDLFRGVVSWGEALSNPLLFMGQANGAIVGVVVALVTILGLVLIKNSKKWIQIIGGVLLIGLFIGIFSTGLVLTNPDSSLHKTFTEQKTGNRFLFWDIARDGFVEKPLLGNGFNNYIYTFQNNFRPEFYQEGFVIESWTNQPHNVFFEFLSTTGIVGTMSFLLLLVTSFVIFLRVKKQDNQYWIFHLVFAGALGGYFIQNLFVFDVPVTYLFLFLIIGIALGVSQKEWNVPVPKFFRINTIIPWKVVIISILGVVFLVILPWKESKMWFRATNRTMITTQFSKLETLQNTSWFGGVADSAFLMDSFFNKYQQDIIKNIQDTKSLESLVATENFLEQGLLRQPNNFRAHLTISKIMIMHMFLDVSTREVLWDRAYNHLGSVQVLNSQNPDTYFEMAHLYIIKQDWNRARAYTRAGIALAPEYPDGYVVANDINRLQPNKIFMDYVSSMKQRWISE